MTSTTDTTHCPVCYADDHSTIEACPEVWIDQETGVRIFTPQWQPGQHYDTREAYDFTQTNDAMRDGDVVACVHEGRQVCAVLVEAWPVAFDGLNEEGQAGELHSLDHLNDWFTLDGGKYVPSIEASERWAEAGHHIVVAKGQA